MEDLIGEKVMVVEDSDVSTEDQKISSEMISRSI